VWAARSLNQNADSHVRAELLLNPLSQGRLGRSFPFSLKLQRGLFKLMNEWQRECLRKSHDDEIYRMRTVVSFSKPD